MDNNSNNSNNLSLLLKSSNDSNTTANIATNIGTNTSTNTSTSNTNFFTGFLDGIKSIGITTWIIIILILAFLGFNIFVYLAKGTNYVESFFTPIISKIIGLFASLTGQIVDVTAEGTKQVVNASASTLNQGLTSVQNTAQNVKVKPNQMNTSANQVQQQPPDIMSNNTLNQSLNTNAQRQSQNNNDYQADESTSTIQAGSGKSGWCYIGEDRGFRSCAEVGQNDGCMSGDIFPSKEICVNPNLRA